MDVISLFIIFFLGTCVGSFLGVVIDRLPRGESIVKGRSRCDHCKRTLSVIDLVPLFSFIFLRGKCRYCHKKLSWFYPLIEIVTGVLFVLTVLFVGQQTLNYASGVMNHVVDNIYYLFIVSCLIALFFIDLKYGILPFSIIFPATIVSFLYVLLTSNYLLFNHLFAAVGAFLFFLMLFLVTRGRGMGFGDVVYAFFMGLLIGFPKIVLGLYIAFVVGALFAVILVLLKRKKIQGSTIPFGPFLVGATLICLFWGDVLLRLTFQVFGFTMN